MSIISLIYTQNFQSNSSSQKKNIQILKSDWQTGRYTASNVIVAQISGFQNHQHHSNIYRSVFEFARKRNEHIIKTVHTYR